MFHKFLKTVGNLELEAIKARVVGLGIMLVSDYKKVKLGTCNWTPT